MDDEDASITTSTSGTTLIEEFVDSFLSNNLERRSTRASKADLASAGVRCLLMYTVLRITG